MRSIIYIFLALLLIFKVLTIFCIINYLTENTSNADVQGNFTLAYSCQRGNSGTWGMSCFAIFSSC